MNEYLESLAQYLDPIVAKHQCTVTRGSAVNMPDFLEITGIYMAAWARIYTHISWDVNNCQYIARNATFEASDPDCFEQIAKYVMDTIVKDDALEAISGHGMRFLAAKMKML